MKITENVCDLNEAYLTISEMFNFANDFSRILIDRIFAALTKVELCGTERAWRSKCR